MSAADDFARQLDTEFETVVVGESLAFHKAVGLRALKSCIDLSAVDTGRLRNNWQLGVEEVRREDFAAGSSREGEQLAAAGAELESLELGGTVFISNPIEYASYLENGTDRMAPQPMVRPTIEAIEAWQAANGGR